MENQEKSEVEKAKELIEKDKQERASKFSEELKALCDKYKCDLTTQITIHPI